MKFTATAKAFSDAISTASRIVENRNTYPILANIHLTAESDRVTLRATDLDIEITLGFEANVESPGVTTIPAKTAADVLRKYDKAADVSFELAEDGNQATVKSGRSRISLATLSPDSFPDLKAGGSNQRWEIAATDLKRLIDKTSFAISTEETRYFLNGIFLHVVEGNLRAVATDGHRLARCDCPAPDGADGMPGIIIPRKTVAEIAKLIDKTDAAIIVEVSDTKLRVTTPGVTLLSKLIEGQFPDYDRVVPKNNDKRAVIDKSSLMRALDRVSTLASDRGGKAVKMALTSDAVTLEVSNPDHGSATEELAATFDQAEPFQIGFNARYLSDILATIDGDTIAVDLNDAGSPTLITAEGGDGTLTTVLMPMRV